MYIYTYTYIYIYITIYISIYAYYMHTALSKKSCRERSEVSGGRTSSALAGSSREKYLLIVDIACSGSRFRNSYFAEFSCGFEEGSYLRLIDCEKYLLIVDIACFRVQGPGFRVPGSGFRVQGSGFRVVVRFEKNEESCEKYLLIVDIACRGSRFNKSYFAEL